MKNTIIKILFFIETIVIIGLSIAFILKVNNSNILENDQEIEKKWLIRQEDIPYDLSKADKYEIIQTYINFSPEIRIRNLNNSEYVLTIKCDTALKGFVREEHEWLISKEEYENLITKKEGEYYL